MAAAAPVRRGLPPLGTRDYGNFLQEHATRGLQREHPLLLKMFAGEMGQHFPGLHFRQTVSTAESLA